MHLPRLYVDTSLKIGQQIVLSNESSHYLLNVLRRNKGAAITLFNGHGGEYTACLIATSRKNAQLQIKKYNSIERESTLQFTLVQAISRSERMDYAIQKAVELGVQHIVPVITERSPPFNKSNKREQHWHKIIISAAEQCGRNRLPLLHEVFALSDWLAARATQENCIVLSPTGKNHLMKVIKSGQPITALIGAEGGFSTMEIQQAIQANYQEIQLGTRILRTETAAITILAVCQALWGDL